MLNVTPEMVKSYLGIDVTDDMIEANISRLIPVADAYLKSAIGEGYPVNDPKAVELGLIIIADLYENRFVTSDKVSNQTRRIVSDFALQLRLEMARAAGMVIE
jgi:hypothetical protein